MVQKKATILNAHGIHCRPSTLIVNDVKKYDGDVRVVAESGESNLRSVLGLVSLGLETGFNVTLEVDGPDEETYCDHLVELFETHFDFPPQ
ncbi:hypothetical protein BVY04_04915 [bacterium M21]|nr:hypothetical protein BVY04_04915 [bacterium M21]